MHAFWRTDPLLPGNRPKLVPPTVLSYRIPKLLSHRSMLSGNPVSQFDRVTAYPPTNLCVPFMCREGQSSSITNILTSWQYNDLEGKRFTDSDSWGAAEYRFTPGAIQMDLALSAVDFAYRTADVARDIWSDVAPSLLGGLQAISGAVQIAGGLTSCVGIITCGAGLVVAAHGLDDLITGIDTASSGELKQSYTNWSAQYVASNYGGIQDKTTLDRIGMGADILSGLGVGAADDFVRTAASNIGRGSLKQAARHAGARLAVEGGITTAVGGAAWAATGSLDKGLFAASFGQMAGGMFANFAVACFTAGTPLVVDFEGGSRPIEEIEVGDYVLARSEFDPDGPLELKRVEEKFIRTALVMELVVQDQLIKTTAEHPFYVPARQAFVPAGELKAGDQLVSHDGRLIQIASVCSTEAVSTVYNLRVADHHTYFVGGSIWGWDVWVHNAKCLLRGGLGSDEIRGRSGTVVGGENLPVVNGPWLQNGAGLIPGQVAEKLRGRKFASFKTFRQEFWMLVAADPVLSKQFKPGNLGHMTKGGAPTAPPQFWVGKGRANQAFNLDHIDQLQEQFSLSQAIELLYDLDNIQVVSPMWNQVRK
jgi:hypothetical protein